MLDDKEALYGGAAGGGKSVGLLMGALQYVHIPSYSSIIFRRTLRDLQLRGALIPRSHEWLAGLRARKIVHWNGSTYTWTFPSGATMSFGYMDIEKDKYKYQGAEFQYIGFDELTQFEDDKYTYLLSRLRRLEGINIPLRVRSTSNPGGVGHQWVKERFVDNPDIPFIPAKLKDNPYIDQDYRDNLMLLDPITRAQLLNGDWTARHEGGLFRREWFRFEDSPNEFDNLVRFWDLAATEKGDYTVGVLLGVKDGVFYIEDVRRMKGTPQQVERLVASMARYDLEKYGAVHIYMEQEPGSSGISTVSHYSRNILSGYTFHGIRSSGSKVERAYPVSSAAENRNIVLPKQASWVKDFIDELEGFPETKYDDQVDALSGAFKQCVSRQKRDIQVLRSYRKTMVV